MKTIKSDSYGVLKASENEKEYIYESKLRDKKEKLNISIDSTVANFLKSMKNYSGYINDLVLKEMSEKFNK